MAYSSVMVEVIRMDEKEFNLKNPDSEVAFTTRTTRGYMTSDRLFLFSIDDGHLAWEYDKTTKTVLTRT